MRDLGDSRACPPPSTPRWVPRIVDSEVALSYQIPLRTNFYSICGSGDDIYVGSEYGWIFVSHDRGRTWDRRNAGPFGSLIRSLWASGPDDVYAVGFGLQGVMHSADRGATWQHLTNGLGDLHFRDVWGSAPDDVFLVGAAGNLLHSADGGITWSQYLADGGFGRVWGQDRNHVFVLGGVNLRTDDGGTTWTEFETPQYLNDLRVRGSQMILATGSGLFVSDDVAASWSAIPSSPKKSLSKLWDRSSELFAVGDNATILRQANAGAPWEQEPALIADRDRYAELILYDIWGDGCDLFAVGSKGLLLHRE